MQKIDLQNNTNYGKNTIECLVITMIKCKIKFHNFPKPVNHVKKTSITSQGLKNEFPIGIINSMRGSMGSNIRRNSKHYFSLTFPTKKDILQMLLIRSNLNLI